MSKRMLLLFCGGGLFVLFVFFSFLVHKDLFTALDFNTTVHFQDNISRRFDTLFSFLSDVGKFEVMSIVLIGILIFVRKIYAGLFTVALFIGFHLFEIFGKFFVNHPPPPQFMLRTEQVLNFPQFHVRQENSYPSGHSGRTVFVAVLLITLILQSRRLSTPVKFGLIGLIVCYVITMWISRIYLGEHWTTDVIGGAILGGSFGLIASAFLLPKAKEHLSHEKNEPKKSLFPKYKIEIKKIEV